MPREADASTLMPHIAWVPDEASKVCQLCGTGFNFLTRRHHCRFCGCLACSECADAKITVGTECHRACRSCRQLGLRKRITAKPLELPTAELMADLGSFAHKNGIKPAYVPLLAKLVGYDMVVVCDDSFAMSERASGDTKQSRWEALKDDARLLLLVAKQFDRAVDFHFVCAGSCLDVRSYDQVAPFFDRQPWGDATTVRTLRNVWRDRHVAAGVERPLVVYLFAADWPTGEHVESWIRRRPNARSTFVSIVLCTEDENMERACRPMQHRVPGQYGWTGEPQGAAGVDVTSDFRGELRDVRRVRGPDFPFSRGDYMVKCLIGAIDPAVHAVDLPAGASIYS
jgi:hypothetical protein